MKILKSIGAFFVAIWRWIKNTAWVQPLLIVGAIFGVIFSIPSITNGIKGLINSRNSADTFFASFKLSMEGGDTSSADTLLKTYYEYEYNEASKKPTLKEEEKKYFLFFTKTGDATANATKEAFEIARDNWKGSSFTIDDNRDFKLYTIFTDETTNQTTADKSAFSQFIDRKSWFFEEAATNAEKTHYFLNGKITKDQLEKLAVPDASTFTVPTIMLIDWTGEKSEYKSLGVSQVMFSLDGTDNWAKAQKLVDCWNGKGDFGPSKS